jgi:phosphoesterase RecJ-like protein
MIIETLKKSKNVLVASHVQPDGDSIGSTLAMGAVLRALGKNIVMYNETPVPAIFRFLPTSDLVVDTLPDTEIFDTAIVLDCSTLDRVGNDSEHIEKIPTIINVDHHQTNCCFGDVKMIKPEACATAEILYDLIKTSGVVMDITMAYAIYTGILTDTGSFLFQNTNKEAFKISAEMVEIGVDPYIVAKNVYATYSLGRLKLLNMVLNTIEISQNGKMSVMSLSQSMLKESDTQIEDINGLVNYAKHIEDVQVAALIQEVKQKPPINGVRPYHVSLRSNGKVNVAAIASGFGGGGHINAAGFSIKTTIRELKSKILEIAESI